MKLLILLCTTLSLVNGTPAHRYAKLKIGPTTVENRRTETEWIILNVNLIDPEGNESREDSTLRLAVREGTKPKRLIDIAAAVASRRGYSLIQLREYLESPRHGVTLELTHELNLNIEHVEDFRLHPECEADFELPDEQDPDQGLGAAGLADTPHDKRKPGTR